MESRDRTRLDEIPEDRTTRLDEEHGDRTRLDEEHSVRTRLEEGADSNDGGFESKRLSYEEAIRKAINIFCLNRFKNI